VVAVPPHRHVAVVVGAAALVVSETGVGAVVVVHGVVRAALCTSVADALSRAPMHKRLHSGISVWIRGERSTIQDACVRIITQHTRINLKVTLKMIPRETTYRKDQ